MSLIGRRVHPVYMSTLFLKTLLILLPYLSLGFPMRVFPLGFQTKILYAFSDLPYACYIPNVFHPSCFIISSFCKAYKLSNFSDGTSVILSLLSSEADIYIYIYTHIDFCLHSYLCPWDRREFRIKVTILPQKEATWAMDVKLHGFLTKVRFVLILAYSFTWTHWTRS